MAIRGMPGRARAFGRWERLDRFFVISALLHLAAALALILWGPTFSGGAPPSPVPIRVVSAGELDGAAASNPRAAPAATGSTEPQPRKAIARPAKVARPAPAKAEVARVVSPAPRPVPPEPEPQEVVAVPAPARRPEGGTGAAAPGEAGAAAGRASGQGVAGLPGGLPGSSGAGEPDFGEYLEQVRRKVMRAWRESYAAYGAQRVNVRLRIQRSGAAYGIQVLASTDARINPSVVAAVERASPFPPIPEDLKSLAGEPIVLVLRLTPE